MWNCGSFTWNLGEPEPSRGTWNLLGGEPESLCGTFVEPGPFECGTCMRNLAEPGVRFPPAAPNHPEALLAGTQVFPAVGEKTSSGLMCLSLQIRSPSPILFGPSDPCCPSSLALCQGIASQFPPTWMHMTPSSPPHKCGCR